MVSPPFLRGGGLRALRVDPDLERALRPAGIHRGELRRVGILVELLSNHGARIQAPREPRLR